MKALSIKTVGLSVSALIVVTYVLCVLFDLIWPGWAMYRVWQVLFPGFGWSLAGFVTGLVEAILYGFYVAIVFVPVYNYLNRREVEAIGTAAPKLTPTAQH